MKITIYTISDCQYSKAEKDYFNSRELPFEEKNLEQNRQFLTEMLEASDNFAGVPFTTIVKDDGSTYKFRGFTKEEFDKVLGSVAPTAQTSPQSTASTPGQPAGQGVSGTPSAQVATPAPVQPAAAWSQPQAVAPVSGQPTAPQGQGQDELSGVLNSLQSASGVGVTPVGGAVAQPQTGAPMSQDPTVVSLLADAGVMPQIPQQNQVNATPNGVPNVPDFQKN